MSKILVIIPIKPKLNAEILGKSIAAAMTMREANPTHEFAFYLDMLPEPKMSSDPHYWSSVARIRNRIVGTFHYHSFDYLLWIDADVIAYPPDMPSKLITANPFGISAPLVLIEGTERLYDTCAFVSKEGGRLTCDPHYWPETPHTDVVEMNGVGTITMVCRDVYEMCMDLEGRWPYSETHENTDHASLCEVALRNGRRVTCLRSCIAYHADLGGGRYQGEGFH